MMDVDFVPASESPMVQADQQFNLAILKEDQEAEAQLNTEHAHAATIEALLQAEPDVVAVNRVAEARLDAERTDAAAIEALLQAEPDILDLNRVVLSSVQSARTLRVNE